MGDRETSRMHKYGESKTTRIMMATVPHVTAWAGCTKYQAAWFLLNRVHNQTQPSLSHDHSNTKSTTCHDEVCLVFGRSQVQILAQRSVKRIFMFSTAPPGKCQGNTSNQVITVSSHIPWHLLKTSLFNKFSCPTC
jgi:hypothetical protein